MTIIGIDPGKSGGIAWQHYNKPLAVEKMPDTLRDLSDLLQDIRSDSGGKIMAYLEQVHAGAFGGGGRKMGVTSAFTFGNGFGHLEMGLTAHDIPFVRIRPVEWQTAMQCKTGGDKNVSKARAQELIPSIKMTHAIADACLICLYGAKTHRFL
jgi:hypothetical protein